MNPTNTPLYEEDTETLKRQLEIIRSERTLFLGIFTWKMKRSHIWTDELKQIDLDNIETDSELKEHFN